MGDKSVLKYTTIHKTITNIFKILKSCLLSLLLLIPVSDPVSNSLQMAPFVSNNLTTASAGKKAPRNLTEPIII